MTSMNPIPTLGLVGYSGSGKTTLLEGILTSLRRRGLRTGVIKHAHHGFDLDTPGKDSHRLRQAGASETLVASGTRWALMVEAQPPGDEPNLPQLIQRLDSGLDLILFEGFKHAPLPRIEVHRPALGKAAIFPDLDGIVAIACDQTPQPPTRLPLLDLNQPEQVTDFILEFHALQAKRGKA